MGGRGDKQRARWACGTCGKPLQSVLTVLSEPAHSVDHKNVHCARGPRAHGGCVQINEGAQFPLMVPEVLKECLSIRRTEMAGRRQVREARFNKGSQMSSPQRLLAEPRLH